MQKNIYISKYLTEIQKYLAFKKVKFKMSYYPIKNDQAKEAGKYRTHTEKKK